MPPRILFISPFFYPEPISSGKYNHHLVKALADKKICVDVICFHPLYPGWRPRRSDAELAGVHIYRGGAWMRYPRSALLRRFVLEIGFLLYLLRHAALIRRYSHVVAVLPPMLFLPLVRLICGPDARIAVVAHDLQGIMAGVDPRSGRSVIVRLVRRLEASVLMCCHRLIVLSQGMADFLAEDYDIPKRKIAVCWPFVTLNRHPRRGDLEHLFARDKKHIVYAGALGMKQYPEGLLSFFRQLVKARKDVVCHLFSGGPIFERLRHNHQSPVDRLMFHDLVDEDDLHALYQQTHIHVIPERIGFSQGAIPSKLPNLLASGVPILYVGQRNGDVWKVIQKAGTGLCTDRWDFQKLNGLVDLLLADGVNRTHADRKRVFDQTLAPRFSVDTVVREIRQLL